MNPQLADLHDIHLPLEPSWWPPAPGWWLLTGLVLVLSGLLMRWLWQQRQRQAWRREALAELARLRLALQAGEMDDGAVLQALSILLRRLLLSRRPREQVAGLHAEAWLRLLDEELRADDWFSRGEGRLLATAPYQATADPRAAALIDRLAHLLRHMPAGRGR
jgi:hypothetical protein